MKTNGLTPPDGGRKIILGCAALGLILMLGASLVYRTENPSLTKHRRTSQQAPMQEAQSDAQKNQLAQLMEQMQADPNNPDILLALSRLFMEQEDWGRAETFLKRAAVTAPGNPEVLYGLGISQFNHNHPEEAAETFEMLIKVKDDPAARFNLGVIYSHYLNEGEKGRVHYQAILDNPDAGDAIKARAQQELERKAHGQ